MKSLQGAVIGIGNPLRGDDGIGPAVVEALRSTSAAERWRLEILESNVCGLGSLLLAHEQVVVVDAVMGLTPGELQITPLAGALRAVAPLSLHELDLGTEVRFARAQGARAMVWLAGIGPFCLDCLTALSPPMQAALPRIVDEIEAALRQRLAMTSAGRHPG